MNFRTFLLSLIVLLLIPLGVYAKGKPVEWTPKKVEQIIGLGDTATIDVTFTSTDDLGPVELWVVPELASFITLSPSLLSVQKGYSYTVQLSFSIPSDMSGKTKTRLTASAKT